MSDATRDIELRDLRKRVESLERRLAQLIEMLQSELALHIDYKLAIGGVKKP